MASWGTERRNTFLTIALIIFLVLAGTYLFFYFSTPPSCDDGKRNGDELGIDCGGSCALACRSEVIDPVIHWVRHFEVVPGVYNVVAYIENLNAYIGTERASYIFKLYDDKNVVLTERTGYITLRPKEIVPIVEGALRTGKLPAVRSTFEFTTESVWEKQTPKDRVLMIEGERLLEVDALPRIVGTLVNTSIHRITDVSLVVIVYDANGNAISSSRTFFDEIMKDQRKDFVFTWPQPFAKPAVRFEIVPLYDTIN